MKRTIFTAVALLIAAAASAQLYHPGEVLSYRVSYKAKFFPNTEVATVDVTTIHDTLDGRPCYRVRGHGRTMPAYRWFFTVDDSYYVWVDPETQRSIRFEGDIREGNYRFRNIYRYDWDSLRVHTWWKKRDLPERTRTMEITERSMDAVVRSRSLSFNRRRLAPTKAVRTPEPRLAAITASGGSRSGQPDRSISTGPAPLPRV